METNLVLEFVWGGDDFKKWIVRIPNDGPTLFTIHDCHNTRDILGLKDKKLTYLKKISIENL